MIAFPRKSRSKFSHCENAALNVPGELDAAESLLIPLVTIIPRFLGCEALSVHCGSEACLFVENHPGMWFIAYKSPNATLLSRIFGQVHFFSSTP